MDNITMKLEKNILTITVDVSKPGHPSTSGKTKLLATTNGTVKIPGGPEGLAAGINVWVPNK